MKRPDRSIRRADKRRGALNGSVPSTTPEQEAEFIRLYSGGLSVERTAEACGVYWSVVQRVIWKAGIVRGKGRIKYPINEHVFDEPLTEHAAYWLGFLLADGCVRHVGRQKIKQPHLQFALAGKDSAHVERFRDFVSPTRPLYWTRPKSHALPLCTVKFQSSHIVECLAKYGIVHNKTFDMKLVPPTQHEAAFWRGAVDGDGDIGIKQNGRTCSVRLCGLKVTCDAFRDWCVRVTGRDMALPVQSARTHFLYSIKAEGSHLPLAILRELYRDATIHLPRKRAVYQRIEWEIGPRLAHFGPRRSDPVRLRTPAPAFA